MNPESIASRATLSVKWSALMEIVSRTASPITFVILARLLAPADFGVLATTTIAVSFAQMFWDAGLGRALIQTREAPGDAAHVVFWTNILLGGVIYGLLFASAPVVAVFFGSPESASVLRVLGLQIIIGSFSSVQQALFVRALDFRSLFWIRLLTAFVPGTFSIPMAYFGCGVWALVAGSLAGQVTNGYMLWRRSTWRPRLNYNRKLARRLYRFGLWVLLEGLGGWLIVWGDNLVVGRLLGVHDLGMYRTGWMIVTILFGLTLNPLLPVLYPAFSRLQDDLPALRSAFFRANRIIIALALPIGTGALLMGHEASDLLFGQKWQGLGFVVGVLGFMHAMAWLVGANPELYRAMGRPDMNTKLMFASLLYYLPAYYLGAQRGLGTFVLTRLAVALVALPIHVLLCIKILRVSPLYLWHEGKPMMLSTLAMASGVAALKWGIWPLIEPNHALLSLAVFTGTGVLIYFACLLLLDRNFVLQTQMLIKRVALSQTASG